MKICSNCRFSMNDDLSFCTNCGTPLPNTQNMQPLQAPGQAFQATPLAAPASPIATPAAAPASPFATPVAAPASPIATPAAAPAAPFATPIATPAMASTPAVAPVPAAKSKASSWIIPVVAALVGAALCFVVMTYLLPKEEASKKKETQTSEEEPSASTEGGSSTTVSASRDQVTIGQYEFTIPSDYTYQLGEDGGETALGISESDNSWASVIKHYSGVDYATIKDNFQTIVDNMPTGYTVVSFDIETIGGVEFAYIDYSYGGQYVSEAFTEVGSETYYITSVIAGYAQDKSHVGLQKTAVVIKTAKKSGSSRAFSSLSVPAPVVEVTKE